MTVKLLTGHHLEIISLIGGCTGLSYTCPNATLLEITYRGSYINMNPDQLFLSDQAELKLHYFQKSLNNIKWLMHITLLGPMLYPTIALYLVYSLIVFEKLVLVSYISESIFCKR